MSITSNLAKQYSENNKNIDITQTNISESVLRYKQDVELIAEELDMYQYVDVILAIIMQESAGEQEDLMQSSESVGLPPNTLKGLESIYAGINHFKQCIMLSNCVSRLDILKLRVAVQGYNFGIGYIMEANAIGSYNYNHVLDFSKKYAQIYGWTTYGDVEYVPHVFRYIGDFGGIGGDGQGLSNEQFQMLNEEAVKYIGLPYVYGGNSPITGFDCSSYVSYVYTKAGIKNIPRTTAQKIYDNYTIPISRESAMAGDLIFFQKTYTHYETITHIGIYLGNNRMIHCGNPIGYADISNPYWTSKFYGFGRIN